MNGATLDHFRKLADSMAGPEPRDWQWVGPHESQRMFGVTEERARGYAERHGGTASRMDDEPVTVLRAEPERGYRIPAPPDDPTYHERSAGFALDCRDIEERRADPRAPKGVET